MTYLVEFPGLGWSFEISRVAFTLFGVPIYWYGVLIGLGMFLAVAFAFTQCSRFGIDGDRMVDVILVGFVLAIVCGRLYYVLFGDIPYTSLAQVLDLRSGGIAIYGGIIGAFVGALLACLWRKVPILPMFDLSAMGFLIGQSIGRWGNFFNQEAFGTNTTLPWGMQSEGTAAYLSAMQAKLAEQGVVVDPALPVHPTFLYESLWCALGFLLLFLYRKRRKFNGEIFLMYVAWYGLGRFFIEGLRTDALMTLGQTMRVSQALAAVSVVGAVLVWVIARVRTAGKPLAVPEVPPHTWAETIETEFGKRQVTLEWPANTKAPGKAQRRQMAQEEWKRRCDEDAAKEAAEQDTAEAGAKAETEAEAEAAPEAEAIPDEKAPADGKAPEESTAPDGGEETGAGEDTAPDEETDAEEPPAPGEPPPEEEPRDGADG